MNLEPGCYIDGHWGHYAMARIIVIAGHYGWEDPAVPMAEVYPQIEEEDFDYLVDASDDALDYLNTIAPPDHSFGWYEGELFLWHSEDWDELES